MSARRSQTAPKGEISPVLYDTAAAAPLALKYPRGLLMTAHPANRDHILQAAWDSDTPIIVSQTTVPHVPLRVYYTTDGIAPSVPNVEPLGFFETFQRLQILAMQRSVPRDSD